MKLSLLGLMNVRRESVKWVEVPSRGNDVEMILVLIVAVVFDGVVRNAAVARAQVFIRILDCSNGQIDCA